VLFNYRMEANRRVTGLCYTTPRSTRVYGGGHRVLLDPLARLVNASKGFLFPHFPLRLASYANECGLCYI
jgi:hypothetical protein